MLNLSWKSCSFVGHVFTSTFKTVRGDRVDMSSLSVSVFVVVWNLFSSFFSFGGCLKAQLLLKAQFSCLCLQRWGLLSCGVTYALLWKALVRTFLTRICPGAIWTIDSFSQGNVASLSRCATLQHVLARHFYSGILHFKACLPNW